MGSPCLGPSPCSGSERREGCVLAQSGNKRPECFLLPADWFPLRPLGGPSLCYPMGGTCMLWERFLLSPGVGCWGQGHTAGRIGPLIDRIQVCWLSQARAPRVQHRVFQCLLSPFSLTRPTSVPPPWEHHRRWFLSRLLRFPAAAAPVSSVSRPSSHDFSFCLSDSFKQKHTSKAPQRGSSLNFSDFGFPIPFPSSLVSPTFLISCDASVKISGMAWG